MPGLDPINQDAFGQALLARFGGGVGRPVIERDDGFIEADGAEYLAPLTDDDELWAWLHRRLGQRVLDVGAGAGRASIVMQREGLRVTALDVSPGAIEVCRRRGVPEVFLGEVQDLADAGTATFDTFLCLGANLGLIGHAAGAGAFFDSLGRLSEGDVRLLGTILNPYITEVPAHLAYHEANRRAGAPAGAVRIRVRYQLASTPWFELRWASPDELAATAGAFGWRVVDLHEAGAAFAAEMRPK